MQNKGLELLYRKGQGADSSRPQGEDGRLDLDLVARTATDVEGVGRDSRNVVRETPQDADLGAGGENWGATTVDDEDEAVAADPAALDGDDAAMMKIVSVSISFAELFIGSLIAQGSDGKRRSGGADQHRAARCNSFLKSILRILKANSTRCEKEKA